jgi:hypothetical protein
MLLGIAIAMIVIALTYQTKSCSNTTDAWGAEVFKINMGMSAAIVCAAVIINFISGLML